MSTTADTSNPEAILEEQERLWALGHKSQALGNLERLFD